MKTLKDKGSYPQWLEHVDQSYGPEFTQAIKKLDNLLQAKFSYYVPGNFYFTMPNVLQDLFEQRKAKRINDPIGTAIMRSLKITCGQFTISPKFLHDNLEISNSIKEVRIVLMNVASMVLSQDSFDELKKLPINNN